MKLEREVLQLQDMSGRGKEILFETNWNSVVQGNKYIKILLDDKEIILSQDQLYSILFMLGNEQLQDKAISKFVVQTPVRNEYHRVGVTTTRDIKKGEEIIIPLSFTVNLETGQVRVTKGRL